MAVPTRLQILGSLHACLQVHHVQPAPSGCAGGDVRGTFFFQLRQSAPNFFHTFPSCWRARMPKILEIRRSVHLLWFSRSKNPKTLPGRDATFVWCTISMKSCVRAYVGRAQTPANFGVIACMRSGTPCATGTLRVCRRGCPGHVFFSTLPIDSKLFPHLPITFKGMHAKNSRNSTLGAFTVIFPVEKPYNTART